VLVLPLSGTAWADGSATASATPSAGDELTDKRAKVAERISKLTPAADTGASADATAKIATEAADELDLLRSLDLVYLQHQAALTERANLDQEKKHLQDEVDALHNFGPAEAKPYSFLLWEDLRDQLSGEEERVAALKSDLAAAQQLLGVQRQDLAECEQQRRQAHEAATENKLPAEQAGLDRELRLAELNSTIAQETVELGRAEIDVKTARQELASARVSFLQEKADKIGKDVKYTEHDYQTRLQDLTKRSDKLHQAIKTAETRLHQHESQRAELLTKLAKDDKSLVAAANEAYELARRVDCELIALVNQRLDELNHFKHFVTCRYQMMNKTASKEDLADWHTQLGELLERMDASEHSLAIRIDEIRVDQATLLEHADDASTREPRLKPFIDLQLDELRHLAERCESGLVHLKAHRRALDRFQGELTAATTVKAESHPIAALRQSFGSFWNYELANVGDDPITVGKIASGIFYLLVGVIVARLLSGLIGRQVLPRFNLNEGAIHAIQAITFYSLCVLFSFEILKLIHVPFASFTFLGGAVAIAVGFGCQNILNNFISGLILLAEQPIRVGDHVEIDGTRGMIEQIGARSTRVKTISNHEMIVPNSKLLEDKVTNLTLSDNLVRTVIAVTLGRSLSVDDVRWRLLQAATSHDKVLADPKPEALLMSFSKTELAFELHFWLKMSDLMDCRVVESDVRQAVSNLLCDTDVETTKAVTTTSAVVPAPHFDTAGEAASFKLPAKAADGRDSRKAG
jgi:small-conductance mechanosensitive channel